MWDFRFSRRREWRLDTAFWDVTPCSLIRVDRRLRGAYYLHHRPSNVDILILVTDSHKEVSFLAWTTDKFNDINHVKPKLL
jgi:hypothetical protein